jgi:hypothetical protein
MCPIVSTSITLVVDLVLPYMAGFQSSTQFCRYIVFLFFMGEVVEVRFLGVFVFGDHEPAGSVCYEYFIMLGLELKVQSTFSEKHELSVTMKVQQDGRW